MYYMYGSLKKEDLKPEGFMNLYFWSVGTGTEFGIKHE